MLSRRSTSVALGFVGETDREFRQLILSLGIALALILLGLLINFGKSLADNFTWALSVPGFIFLANFLVVWLIGLLSLAYVQWRRAVRENIEREDIIASIDPDVLLVVDVERNILFANESAALMFGYESQELANQKTDLLYCDRRTDSGDHLEVHNSLEEHGYHVGSATGSRKSGAQFPLEIISGKLHRHGGAVLLLRDVTDRRRLEESLHQQQKLASIGTLAGGVAHEINNPIAGIMNYAQLIKDGLAGKDDKLDAFAGEIIHETERVADIIRNLLQFARDDKGQHSPARIIDIVNGTLPLIRTVIKNDKTRLEVDVPHDLPEVKCRSQEIQQVIMNLLTNARDALNERYPECNEDKMMRLTATVFERDGKPWVRTVVEDHGTGVSEDMRTRMFEPFATTKRPGRGTGLGLSVSHTIVRQHGGELTFESEEGKYTRFHLDLPVDNGWELGSSSDATE